MDYYKKIITGNPDWSFAGIYPDAYYTGTRDDRPQFVQLIKDCNDGKIDRIITKAIANSQRYCRFTVDSGCLPLAPHLYFPQFMDDSNGQDHNTAMFMNMILMTKCTEV